LGFLFMAYAHGAAWELSADQALMGFGTGAAFSALSNLVVESVPEHQTGVASGMNANIRTIGGSIGSQVCGSIIAATIVGTSLPKESGFVTAFLFLMAISVVAAGAAALIPKPPRYVAQTALAGEEAIAAVVAGAAPSAGPASVPA
jgi:MFS family permease